MMEQIKFINHLNEVMEWGKNGIYVNYNNLHDYSWNFTSNNSRISSFSKGIVKKTIPLIICCESKEHGIELRNRLLEIAEKDILAREHGKIVIGDYYLKCFITGSKKEEYLIDKGYMVVSLTIATDYPQWVKESETCFRISMNTSTGEEDAKHNFDYSYDFAHDYTSEMHGKLLMNTGFVGTNFRLIIHGAAINPKIYIAGHLYEVTCNFLKNEYLTIDSMAKTIVLTKSDGTKVNLFNKRNRESYVFEKIQPGENSIIWDGDFGFDVILLEERSEPKWT